ncbi:MAG: hypothetical protein JRI68_12035 [Deltaproteobacteria bacterium]|nr:hypothetical protein [Deltaproteobacteria bacterium]
MESLRQALKAAGSWPVLLSRALLVVMVVASLAPSAFAKGSPVAEQLFIEGQQLMDAGEHEAACAKFDASMEADASGGTALNLGRCNELLGRTASAWVAFKKAATLLAASGEADREKFALEQAAAMEAKLSRLTIEVSPTPEVQVTLDGDAVASAAWGTAVPADPGVHQIEATAPGREAFSTTVLLGADGDAQMVTVPELAVADGTSTGTSPDTAEDGMSGAAIAGAVLLGVGGVSLVIGGVFGGLVLSDAGAAEDDETLCPEKQCTPAGREAIDEAETKALVSSVLIGVGAGAVVGGVILLLVGGSSDEGDSTARLTPSVSAEGAGLQMTVRF